MSHAREIVVVANTRLPSQRAQALQVVQTSAAFERCGYRTTVLHALRAQVEPLPAGVDVYTWYGVPAGPRPVVRAVPCVDWIDAVPVRWQYWPARLQERTFARNAARVVAREHPQAFVYAREVEAALPLLRKGRKGVFLEVHRVPEGRLRRAELLECAQLQAGCVAISGGVQADLLALGVRAEQVVVEHDGFESTRFAHLPDKAVARQKLGLAPDVSVVVYTGGLLEWKGVDVLVDAARLLPHVQFVIAGGMASDVARLRVKAAGLAHVRIDGFVAPELVSLYLAAGDVGVVPNRSQPAISSKYTSPLKVFESLCSGLPLVVSDLPSMRDVLTEHTAEFVQPDDPAALAAGLQRLLADPVRRAYLTEHGRSAAHGRDWDTRAQRLVAWMDAYSKR